MTIKSTTRVGNEVVDSKDLHHEHYSFNNQTQSVEPVVEDKLPPVSKPKGYGEGLPVNPRKERELKQAIKKDLQQRKLK